jgi:methylenetetrahydrofolate dehydrogenase (NADP+)/methenyltetrahydrofolate cyclohydrolase
MRPGLAVILVGEDPASQVYVRNKVKACQEAGLAFGVREIRCDADRVRPAGAYRGAQCRSAIHGILVQMPLPGTSTRTV